MRKLVLTLALFSCCAGSYVYAGMQANQNIESKTEKKLEKHKKRIYLPLGSAFITAKDIFVKIDQQVIRVYAIYADEKGVYIYENQLCTSCNK